MSTKTTFKRIALSVVGILGLSLVTVIPSQAAVLDPIITTTDGTATTVLSDSTTAGSVTVKFSSTTTDTMAVTFIQTAGPATMYVINGFLGSGVTDTAAATASTGVDTTGSTAASLPKTYRGGSTTVWNTAASISNSDSLVVTGVANQYLSTKFLVNMDSRTSGRVAGTYTFTALARFYADGGALSATKTASISFVVSAPATSSLVANAGTSQAYLSASGGGTADEVVSAVGTASNDPAALLEVKLRNASSNTTARESVTVTTTLGAIGTSGGTFGKSLTLVYNSSDSLTVYVRPDGTYGTGTITVSTPSITFAPKTIIFYTAAPKTLTASLLNSAIGAGSNSAVIAVKAVDANGNPWAGTLYTYSDATSVASNSASSCSYNSTNGRHECSVTGVANGTANITVRDAATVATSTVASSAVAVTVNTNAAATLSLAWDKASYGPGEKATLIIKALDSAGKSVRAQTLANAFATGGISLNIAGSNGSDTITNVSITTASLASANVGSITDPVKTYTVYMPYNGGTVTATATGGTSLPLAGQVAITASATVSDPGSSALAAVTALASQVSAFITKINAQITTLTDLVMKIQKKVKA